MFLFGIRRSIGYLVLLLIAGAFSSCSDSSSKEFIHIDEDRFVINGKKELLMTMNYVVTFQTNGTDFWPCSYQDYMPDKRFTHNDRANSLKKMSNELQLIADLGFNSIRVVKLIENIVLKGDSAKPHLKVYDGEGRESLLPLDSKERVAMFLRGVKDFNQIANRSGLGTILLARIRPDQYETLEFFHMVLDEFKNDPSILGYDIFNEPLYFDSVLRKKPGVVKVMDEWMPGFRKHDPNHLFTIGLAGMREVFRWDPNILDVDFISFHPYEYETDQVRNELYWYGRYVQKPWVVGETSIPADNDSVPYEDQVAFVHKTFDQACACGAAGYAWWQFKDVKWPNFHPSYMGVLSIDGSTTNSLGQMVAGSPKPVALAFRELAQKSVNQECLQLSNYYNYDSHTGSKLTGRVVDDLGEPIQGAVILAWDRQWMNSHHTVSKADGTFQLLGPFYFHHWMASATDHTMIRDDVRPNSARADLEGIPTMHLGTLNLVRRKRSVLF